MKPVGPSFLIAAAVVAVTVAGLPAHASAAGPPLLGGEGNEVVYQGKITGGGKIEIRVAAATDRVTHMFFQSRRVVRCQRGRDSDVGLWQTPFRLGADRRAVKRERYSDKAGAKHALMTWDLRFAADWKTATARVADRYQHNTLGRCAGTFKTTLRRTAPRGAWQLGRYAGTTSQGQPIAFTAGFKRLAKIDLIDFTVTDITAMVTFPCQSGDVTQPVGASPNELDAGALILEGTQAGGQLLARLVPPGATDPAASIEALVAGSSASGTLTLHGVCADGGNIDRTTVTFSAAHSG